MSKTYTYTASTTDTDLFFGKHTRFKTDGDPTFDPWAEAIYRNYYQLPEDGQGGRYQPISCNKEDNV